MNGVRSEATKPVTINYPKDELWLAPVVNALAKELGISVPAFFRRCVCELYGERFPELKENYEKLKKLHGGI